MRADWNNALMHYIPYSPCTDALTITYLMIYLIITMTSSVRHNELLLGTREVINNVLDPTPSNALISGRGLSNIAYSVVEACFLVVSYIILLCSFP